MDKQASISIMTTDFTIQNVRGIILIEPHTDTARVWLEENIGHDNGFQPWWPTVVVERNYMGDIIDGMQEYGLTVIGDDEV